MDSPQRRGRQGPRTPNAQTGRVLSPVVELEDEDVQNLFSVQQSRDEGRQYIGSPEGEESNHPEDGRDLQSEGQESVEVENSSVQSIENTRGGYGPTIEEVEYVEVHLPVQGMESTTRENTPRAEGRENALGEYEPQVEETDNARGGCNQQEEEPNFVEVDLSNQAMESTPRRNSPQAEGQETLGGEYVQHVEETGDEGRPHTPSAEQAACMQGRRNPIGGLLMLQGAQTPSRGGRANYMGSRGLALFSGARYAHARGGGNSRFEEIRTSVHHNMRPEYLRNRNEVQPELDFRRNRGVRRTPPMIEQESNEEGYVRFGRHGIPPEYVQDLLPPARRSRSRTRRAGRDAPSASQSPPPRRYSLASSRATENQFARQLYRATSTESLNPFPTQTRRMGSGGMRRGANRLVWPEERIDQAGPSSAQLPGRHAYRNSSNSSASMSPSGLPPNRPGGFTPAPFARNPTRPSPVYRLPPPPPRGCPPRMQSRGTTRPRSPVASPPPTSGTSDTSSIRSANSRSSLSHPPSPFPSPATDSPRPYSPYPHFGQALPVNQWLDPSDPPPPANYHLFQGHGFFPPPMLPPDAPYNMELAPIQEPFPYHLTEPPYQPTIILYNYVESPTGLWYLSCVRYFYY